MAACARARANRAAGQKGHRGDTLRQVVIPDRIVEHAATVCRHCCAELDAGSAVGAEKRHVFDLPERMIEVTEHRAAIHCRPNCRGETRAAFPEGVVSPTQYGERIKAAAIYHNVQQLIPEDRAAQALSDLFGAPLICPASVVAWAGKKARELGQVYEAIGERVAEAKVRHRDETGYRIAGKLHWLHTTSSRAFTSIARAKSAATSRRICRGASSCTTTSCRIAGWTRSTTPSARFPQSQKSIRTTNAIERLHEEFKRRIKTQTVLPSAETAAMLFWGLLASGQIMMRKVDSWNSLAEKPSNQFIDLAA